MEFFQNAWEIRDEFFPATLETLYMTVISAVVGGFIGLVLGVILTLTDRGGLLENRPVHVVLDKVVNLLRAIPFIVLLAMIAPFTRLIVGTTIGEKAALVPLTFGMFPFFARQVQNALASVDDGVVEASLAMGDTPWEVVTQVYLREGLPHLVRATALSLISLVGLTAMAGAIGAGGLGKLAIAQGYNRFQTDVTLVATVIILLIVFCIQAIADGINRRLRA